METTGVTKTRVLIETKVVIEPGYIPRHARESEIERHKWLTDWAKEIMEFFRDHRSMDVHSVSAEPTYEVQCSGCHHEWEEMIDESGVTCCASCGEPMATCT